MLPCVTYTSRFEEGKVTKKEKKEEGRRGGRGEKRRKRKAEKIQKAQDMFKISVVQSNNIMKCCVFDEKNEC